MILTLSLIFISDISFCVYTVIDCYHYLKEKHDYED